MKKLPLAGVSLANEDDLKESLPRLSNLAAASALDLTDEVAWEVLADQCEESGEPEGVIRLALVTAWRVALQHLHGLCVHQAALMLGVGCLKSAVASESILRNLKKLKPQVADLKKKGTSRPTDALLALATELKLERIEKLHDRLRARGLMREK